MNELIVSSLFFNVLTLLQPSKFVNPEPDIGTFGIKSFNRVGSLPYKS